MHPALWLVSALAISGVVLNIYKVRWCFAVWLVTNTTWAIVDFTHGLAAQGALFTVYAGMSVWGLWKWRGSG